MDTWDLDGLDGDKEELLMEAGPPTAVLHFYGAWLNPRFMDDTYMASCTTNAASLQHRKRRDDMILSPAVIGVLARARDIGVSMGRLC